MRTYISISAVSICYGDVNGRARIFTWSKASRSAGTQGLNHVQGENNSSTFSVLICNDKLHKFGRSRTKLLLKSAHLTNLPDAPNRLAQPQSYRLVFGRYPVLIFV